MGLGRLGLRLTVLGIALAAAIAGATLLIRPTELRAVGWALLAVAVALPVLSYLPGLGREEAVVIRPPRGFKVETHCAVSYPEEASVFGYEVRLHPKRRFNGLRYRVTADTTILNATTTISRSVDGELVGWWGVDPIRREGATVEFGFSLPSIEPGVTMSVRLDTPTPLRKIEIQHLRGPIPDEPALDLYTPLMSPEDPTPTKPGS